jgi:protein-S-isoprenylcysteine O-methyltransferase
MNLPYSSLLGVFFALSEAVIGRTRRATKANFTLKDQNSLRLLGVVIWSSVALAVAAIYLLPAARMPHYRDLFLPGLVVFAAGTGLRWYSIWILGRFFTVNVAIASDHRLIEAGPYRRLRHPSYTGAMLAFLGLGLCMGNFISLAVLVIPVFLAFRRRMEIEEGALLERFGGEYRAYLQRTNRLLPFIY